MVNTGKSKVCLLSVEKRRWAAAVSFSHPSTNFGGLKSSGAKPPASYWNKIWLVVSTPLTKVVFAGPCIFSRKMLQKERTTRPPEKCSISYCVLCETDGFWTLCFIFFESHGLGCAILVFRGTPTREVLNKILATQNRFTSWWFLCEAVVIEMLPLTFSNGKGGKNLSFKTWSM